MTHKVFTLAVFSLLLAPSIIGLAGLYPNINTEKAWSQEYNKPNKMSNIKGWMNYVDEQYGRKFPGRSLLFSLSSRIKFRIFNESILPQKARIGTDGYMFLGNAFRNSHLSALGVDTFSLVEKRSLKHKLDRLKQLSEEQNIPVLILIAPNKFSIYPEKIDYSPVYDNLKLKQFKDLCPLKLIDSRKALIKKKSSTKLYYKTDSHWTAQGAYIAYQDLIKNIAGTLPYKMVALDDYSVKWKKSKLDIATLLDINIYEEKAILTPKFELNTIEERGEKLLKYSCPDSGNTTKVLVYRDSFGRELTQFLAGSFGTSTYIWNYKIDKETLLKEKPDLIIIEVVERSIERLRGIAI